MPIRNLEELKVALAGVSDTDKATQAAREKLLSENIRLLRFDSIDISPDYQLSGKRIMEAELQQELGLLGRILFILDLLQEKQIAWGNSEITAMVQRGCELALTLMERTSDPRKRTVFASQYGYKLTLCSSVDYYLRFVALLPEEERLAFTLASDRHVQKRFLAIDDSNLVYTIAANFRAVHHIPKNKRAEYITNFENLARTINLGWVKTFGVKDKIPLAFLKPCPRPDYLIDLLAIIPEKARLNYAMQLVISFGSRTEYHPPNLASLDLILSYLDNQMDKEQFAVYFKSQIPMIGNDLASAKTHADPIINKIFNDQKILSFFEIQQKQTRAEQPHRLIAELTADRAQEIDDDVYVARCQRLDMMLDEVERDGLVPDHQQAWLYINSLEYLEAILTAIQLKDQGRVRWSNVLEWLAERAAFLYVAQLSQLPIAARKDFAVQHMSHIVWTDMRFTLQVVDLLKENPENVLDFMFDSTLLPDTELENCESVEGIVGLMTILSKLPDETQRETLKDLLITKISKIDWDAINWALIAARQEIFEYYDPNHMIGVLFIIPQLETRVAMARFLIQNTTTTNGICFKNMLNLESLATLLTAFADIKDKKQVAQINRELVTLYIQSNYLTAHTIDAAEALLQPVKPPVVVQATVSAVNTMPIVKPQINSLACCDVTGHIPDSQISRRMTAFLERLLDFANIYAPIQVGLSVNERDLVELTFSVQAEEKHNQRLASACFDWFLKSLQFFSEATNLSFDWGRISVKHIIFIPRQQLGNVLMACGVKEDGLPSIDDNLRQVDSSENEKTDSKPLVLVGPAYLRLNRYRRDCESREKILAQLWQFKGCQIAFITEADRQTEKREYRKYYGLWFQSSQAFDPALLIELKPYEPELYVEEVVTQQAATRGGFFAAKTVAVGSSVHWLFLPESGIPFDSKNASKFSAEAKPNLTSLARLAIPEVTPVATGHIGGGF